MCKLTQSLNKYQIINAKIILILPHFNLTELSWIRKPHRENIKNWREWYKTQKRIVMSQSDDSISQQKPMYS